MPHERYADAGSSQYAGNGPRQPASHQFATSRGVEIEGRYGMLILIAGFVALGIAMIVF